MSRLQIDTDQHVAKVLSEHVDRQFDRLKRQIDILAGQIEGLRRSQATYLGDHVACTTLRNGRRILVDTMSYDVGVHLLTQGEWERIVTRIFEKAITRGATVVDAGAHLGYYTLTAAPLVGPDGRVIAVEPNGRLANLLHHSIGLNGFRKIAEVHAIALWSGDTTLGLRCHPNYSGAGEGHEFTSPVKLDAMTPVAATSLDALMEGAGLQPDVVKIDVEGAEGRVLSGMTRILSTGRRLRIIMELDLRRQDVASSLGPVVNLLEQQGFVPMTVVHESLCKATTWSELLAGRACHDLVVVRADDQSWLS